jgi:hypothetical protein
MTSCSRIALIGKGRQGVFHCWTRCAQHACLLGPDPKTGKDCSYRRAWIIIREEQLAALFAIDIEFRAEMRNHLHVVLRTMPRVAKRLGREEVVRRWLTITKLAKCMSDDLPEINPKLVKKLAKDKKKVEQMRRRLSSISWFMGTLCENISRRSNAEAGTSGHFWESRFKCRECLDENAVLLCGIYVDLNPIKAGEAASPEKARYTSIYTRLQAQSQRKNARNRADGWLGELTLQPESKKNESLADSSRSGRRASDMGILSISLADYLKLLKWTAKLLRSGERKTIPKDLATILDYMDVNAEAWLDTVNDYEDSFCHVVGTTESIAKVAERLDIRCMKGTTASRRIFG